MKRLAVYDFDGTLVDTPEEEAGKKQWEEVKGEKYPYPGWWGRKESLDTEVFDIKTFPSIEALLRADVADPDTTTIILTSRREKLRPQVEDILKLHGIVVDDVILKRGNEDKGDVILRIENYNQDLEEIVVYDDFSNMEPHKIAEFTKIKDKLADSIQYHIFYVENGKTQLMESTNILLKMIHEEIHKIK